MMPADPRFPTNCDWMRFYERAAEFGAFGAEAPKPAVSQQTASAASLASDEPRVAGPVRRAAGRRH